MVFISLMIFINLRPTLPPGIGDRDFDRGFGSGKHVEAKVTTAHDQRMKERAVVMMETRRYHDLDFVRAAAMLLGLVLHVSIFFTPSDVLFWGAGEYSGDEVNRRLVAFIHLFRMQLFFLMAGFFAQLVIDRKGFQHLVGDRLKRILLPFVAAIVLLIPIHILLMNGMGIMNGGENYYNTVFNAMDFPERFRSVFMFSAFDGVPGLNDDLLHFWFIYYLIIFYAIHFLARPLLLRLGVARIPGLGGFMKMTVGSKWGFLLLALIGFPFQYLLTRIMFWPSGFNVPIIDLAYYFVFYLFGVGLYSHRDLLGAMARNAWFLIMISLPLVLLVDFPSNRIDRGAPVIVDLTTWKIFNTTALEFHLPILHSEGIFHGGWDKVLMALVRSGLCWTLALGCIGLAHRYLDKPRPTVRYLADSAYWVYWIHLPITVKLSLLAQQVPWGSSLFKSYVVLVVSTLIVYWSYNTFVRYTWLGDFFMGGRKSRSDPGESDFRLLCLIRRTGPNIATLGAIVFVTGAVMQYEYRDQNQPALKEAFVTRDRSVLDSYESIDGIRDHFGNTPIHTATRRSWSTRIYDPVPMLISKSGDLDARNDFERTALFMAVRMGNRNDVLALLKAGADPNIPDRHGHTPSHVAAIKAGNGDPAVGLMFLEILDDLVEHGADLEIVDSRGRTVETCLVQFGGDAHRRKSIEG